MPSVPTHFLVGAALGQAAALRLRSDWRFWTAALVCSALPDVDVIGFGFGVRYGDLWGHRGITHSILSAAVAGIVVGNWFDGSRTEKISLTSKIGQSILFFFITASHGVLDAMTNGGLGIAFFSPFNATRYFLPWRPIVVSPIGAAFFFSAWISGNLERDALGVAAGFGGWRDFIFMPQDFRSAPWR